MTHYYNINKISLLSILTSFVLAQSYVPFAYAGSDPEKTTKKGTAFINTQIQQQTTPSQGVEGTKSNTITGSDLANALNAAESASAAAGQQSSGAGFNMIMSGITGATGAALMSSPEPSSKAMGKFMLVQSALSLLQSLNQGKTSKANLRSGNDFSTYDAINDPTLNSNKNTGYEDNNAATDDSNLGSNTKSFNSTKNDLIPSTQEILKKIEDHGFKVDLNKNAITTPDGNNISLSEASNGSAIEAKLGLPPGTYEKGMGLVEDIAKRQNLTGSHGGELNPSSYGSNGDSFDSEDNAGADGLKGSSKTQGADSSRTPASALVAGLTSKYKGENIGVAADDIFMMVTRRYQLKNKQDSFITPEHPQKGVLASPLQSKK